MAYRAVVEKPQTIRALVSSTNISVVDAQLEKTASVISARSYNASVTARVMNAIANYSNAATQIHYRKLLATDLALDPFSLNKYFRLDQAAISDAISMLSNKGLNDVAGFSDTQSFATDKSLQDSTSLSDLPSLLTSRTATDSIAIAEVFQKVTTFNREITDSAIITDVRNSFIGKALSETAAMSDVLLKDTAYNRTFADAVSFAEQYVAAFEKGLLDTATITESIQISTRSLASSVLNAGALNSTPFNN